jgi:hypothetical protein
MNASHNGVTTGDHGNARTTSDVRITLGHVTGTLLVTHQDVANSRLEQRVVCRQDATTWQTKHHIYVLHLEAANQCFCAGDLLTELSCFRLLGCHVFLRI